ncbi:hypothetical protein GCM10007866_18770 [Gluconobacter albidus]|uniref:Transposase n=1 Tax=Gluconobacter albidus TaxID=318683 RepID=A0ABQ5X0T5_9PROT|nr:hypothetical protein AA3250_1504 [Gluconobacter albidus NBRC 3250]GLQ69426.1 hypothetical protein GCM10007866_18770 [Gluconobacter albidus]
MISLQGKPSDATLLCFVVGVFIARIGVAHDTQTGIVGQRNLQTLIRIAGAVGDDCDTSLVMYPA